MAGNNNRVFKLSVPDWEALVSGPLPGTSDRPCGCHDQVVFRDRDVTRRWTTKLFIKFRTFCALPESIDVKLEALQFVIDNKVVSTSGLQGYIIGNFTPKETEKIYALMLDLKWKQAHIDPSLTLVENYCVCVEPYTREPDVEHVNPFAMTPLPSSGVQPWTRCTTLNGSHGEVTETDDVAKKGISFGKKLTPAELVEYKRSMKEIANRERAQAIGRRKGSKNRLDSLPEPVAISPDVETMANHTVVPFQVPDTPYQVFMDFSDTRKGVLRLYTHLTSGDFQVVKPGDPIMNVVEENYGCYTTRPGKGKNLIASSPFTHTRINSCESGVRCTDTREGIVFNSLLRTLHKEFKSSKVSLAMEASYTVALKNVVSQGKELCEPGLPTVVVEWFHSVCEFTEMVYKLKVIATHAEKNVCNNLFLPTAIRRHTSMKVRTRVIDKRSSSIIPLATLLLPYDIKPNILMRRNKHLKPLTRETWFDNPPWPLSDIAQVYDRPEDGQATSVWASLADFVRYKSKGTYSENNLFGALKRVFGARDQEQEYQKHQSNLCVVFANHYGNFMHLFKKLNVKFTKVPTVQQHTVMDPTLGIEVSTQVTLNKYILDSYPYLEGTNNIIAVDHVDQLLTQHQFVLSVFDHFTSRVSPTIGELTYDLAHNVVTAIESKAYTIWSHIIPAFIWRQQFAEEPHPKKLERLRMNAGVLQSGVGCLVNSVTASVKDEIAKNGGKMPRVYMGYDRGVMYAPNIPERFKERINGFHYFTIGRLELLIIVYAKPKSSELEKLFEALIRAWSMQHDHLCVAIYSDDSCYSGKISGVPFGFNVDISSCDSSNGPPIFFLTIMMMSKIDPVFAEQLMEQCCKPIKIVHPTDSQYNFELLLPTAFEGSGTVLTTCLNHVASILIAASVAHVLHNKTIVSSEEVGICIQRGAALVGHKVTTASIEVDGQLQPSRFQFLKISPMLCTHKITREKKLVPTRNIGSIIKSFGKLTTDMEGYQVGMPADVFSRLTYAERFDKFFGSVILGYKNEPSSPILDALRTRFQTVTPVEMSGFTLVEKDIDYSMYVVDSTDLYNRYSISDYDTIVNDLIDLQLGDICDKDPVLETIMKVDYEYEPKTYEVEFAYN